MPIPAPIVVNAAAAGFAFGKTAVLRDLDLTLRADEWVFVLGPPGAGKTTLLRLAAGAIAPTSGALDRKGRAELVLHDTPLDDAAKALDIVSGAMAGDTGAARARAEKLLRDLGLEAYLGHEPFRLSRGYRKRLEIAAALASGPALLALDDPFSPMDQTARRKTADVLRRAAQQEGLAVLMVSNDPLDALRYGDRALTLSPGPGAHILAVHAIQPQPDAAADELAALPVCEVLEAALWDEDPA